MNSQLSEIEKDMTTSCQVLVERSSSDDLITPKALEMCSRLPVSPQPAQSTSWGLSSTCFRLSSSHVSMRRNGRLLTSYLGSLAHRLGYSHPNLLLHSLVITWEMSRSAEYSHTLVNQCPHLGSNTSGTVWRPIPSATGIQQGSWGYARGMCQGLHLHGFEIRNSM